MSDDNQALWDRFNELVKLSFGEVEDGDLKGYIYSFRKTYMAVMGVEEFNKTKKHYDEMTEVMIKLVGDDDPFKAAREKDAPRLFKENWETILESCCFPVLNATDIDDGIEKYQKCNAYVFDCWRKALNACRQGDYPQAVFLSILALEEAAKFHQAWYELFYNDGKPINAKKNQPPRRKDYKFNHKKKHFVSIVSGALLNHRVEGLFGKDKVVEFVGMAENGELENVRQSCLYATVGDEGPVYPDDVISQETAIFYVVFLGEAIGEFVFSTSWEYRDFKEEMDAVIEEFGLPAVS